MRFLPKKYFKWREPEPFLQTCDEHERKSQRWWNQPLAALIVCALGMLTWFLARFVPGKHPPSTVTALLLTLFLGFFLAYLKPWIVIKCPSEITIFDRKLLRSRVDRLELCFADLVSFEWRFAPEFSTLILKHRRGRDFFIGVPPAISTEVVSAFLAERIPQDTSAT